MVIKEAKSTPQQHTFKESSSLSLSMRLHSMVMLLEHRQPMPSTRALNSLRSEFHFYIPHSSKEIQSSDTPTLTTSIFSY